MVGEFLCLCCVKNVITILQFQLIIEPKSMEKAIKLQLPIVLGTYPFRSTNDAFETWPDSVLRPDTHYPSSLPVFRPSLQ